MRWRRIAFWSVSGLFVLIVAVISWLLLADLGSFKPQIEQWASDKTGRQISINGPLHIGLGRKSAVVAEDIRIGNATWAEQADMVSVGRLEVQVDLGAILDGLIVVDLIDLDGATIFLAQPETGDPNWVLIEPSSQEADSKDADEKKTSMIFKQVDIDDLQLTFNSANRPAPIEIEVKQLRQRHREDDLLELSLDGTLNDRHLKLDGEIGTFEALLVGEDMQFDLGGRLDTFSVSADGRIDNLINPRRPRINFTASTPDVNDLLRALGATHEGEGDIDLVGSLTPEDQGPLVLDVAGKVGRLDVEASGAFSDLQGLENIKFDLVASSDDVRAILEAVGFPQTQATPFLIDLDARRDGKMFTIEKADMAIGNAKFGLSARLPDFPRIDDSVAQLQIEGPDIERFRRLFKLPGAATGPFSGVFTIDVADDGFEVVNIDLQTSLGKLHADGRLGDAPDFFDSTARLEISSPSLAVLADAYGVEHLPDAPIELRGSVYYGPDGIRSQDPLTITVNEITLKVDGLIKVVSGLLGSDFELEVDGPDLAELVGAFGTNKAVPAQPYELGGQLQIRDDGFRFREVAGKLGTSDVEIDGLLVLGSGIAGSRFNFMSRGAVFSEITDQLGDFELSPGPYEVTGAISFAPGIFEIDGLELSRATGKLDLDLQLGLPVSRKFVNVDLRASGPNVQSFANGFANIAFDQAPFLVDLEGTMRGSVLSVENLDVNIGLAKLSGAGTLEFEADAQSTQFDFNMNIPDLGALGEFGDYRMREQSFALEASVTGGGGVLRIDPLAATLGPSDITGNVEYHVGDVPQLDVNISSDSIVFAPLLVEEEPEYDPTPEFDDGRIIPDVAIPFEAMAGLNANIDIEIGELQRDALHIRDVVFRADLQDGVLDISEAGFQAKSGAIVGRAHLDPNNGQGVGKIEIVGRELALGMTELNANLAMRGDLDINLDSTGNDMRTLLGNTSGVFFVRTNGGRLPNNKFLKAFYGNLLDEVIGTINPFSKTEEYTTFDCIILPIRLDGGVVMSDPGALVATSNMQMVVSPEVDLKTEALEVNIRTIPKKGISFSAGEVLNPYIKVVGSLAAPKLAVDETGVLISGGAAVATGGLSILARAAWTRVIRSKDPCGSTAEEGIEALGERFSDLSVSISPQQ